MCEESTFVSNRELRSAKTVCLKGIEKVHRQAISREELSQFSSERRV